MLKHILLAIIRWLLCWRNKLERFYLRNSVGRLGESSVIYEGVQLIGHPGNVRIGSHSTIYHGTVLATGENGYIELGDHSHLGVNVYLNATSGRIRIGNHVAVAPLTQIYSYSNSLQPGKWVDECHAVADVAIQDNVLIGSSVTVLPGVTVHEGAVVGAGAVVTSDVPAYTIVGGVPARKIGNRSWQAG